MSVSIVVPQLGESIVEGTVSKWLKAEGDAVKIDEPVVEIMTDKVTVEIPAPVAGRLARLLVPEGTTVPVGEEIAVITAEGEELSSTGNGGGAREATAVAPQPSAAPAPALAPAAQAPAAQAPAAQAPAAQAPAIVAPVKPLVPVTPATPVTPVAHVDGKRGYLSPIVRRLAREHGIDASQVSGTGRSGRVTRDDMLAFIESVDQGALTPAPARASGPMEEVIPLAGIRKVIAERMTISKFTATHVTTFEEVDVSALVRLRAEYKQEILERQGVRLTFTPFFVKAVVLALRDFPNLNATWQGKDAVVVKRYYNMGVAVGRDEGLMVPVVKDAGNKSLIEVARTINDLSERAHANRLAPEDLQGGTFSITNAGLFGSFASTPIINFPEVAILGVHKISPRPVVVDGEIVVRPVTNLALTFDHRWIDGHIAVQFIVRIKDILEKPELLWFSV